MALVKSINGSGNSGLSAQAIVGFVSLAQAATASAQGGQSLPTSIVEYTTSTSNYGPTLPADAAQVTNTQYSMVQLTQSKYGQHQAIKSMVVQQMQHCH